MRVLLIEDEEEVRRKATLFLCDAGCSVATAENGEYGVFKSKSWDFDLILLDGELPECDTSSVLEQLRRQNINTPILMLITRDKMDDRPTEHGVSADGYLIKPFTRSELIASVQSLIRQVARDVQSVIEIGPVTIDTSARKVAVNRCGVSMTAKEYCLLEFLAIHRGRLVSRTEIYDHLFDEFDSSLANLVDVYISKIRRKIGGQLIKTRRGMGYIIDG